MTPAQIISYEEYYPYGSTSYQAGRSAAETSLKRYRYTGMERDEESGFCYHGARYYAPWLGRWTRADPAGLADGPNRYRYSRNNPVCLYDPGGMEPLLPAGQGRLVTPDQLRELGIDPSPLHEQDESVSSPVAETINKKAVNLNNVDKENTKQTTLDKILNSPEYVDAGIVKVYVKGDLWTFRVDEYQFEYANGSRLTIPAGLIDVGPGPGDAANEFTKIGGVIFPGTDGAPAFDRMNTPRIIQGVELI